MPELVDLIKEIGRSRPLVTERDAVVEASLDSAIGHPRDERARPKRNRGAVNAEHAHGDDDLRAAIDLRDRRIEALVREVEELHLAMAHRAAIEQAKGVIMSTMRCGPDAAFAVLAAQSQSQNRKLRDVAAELAAMHDLGGHRAASDAEPG